MRIILVRKSGNPACKIFFACVSLFISLSANSQDRWTLQQCIDYAIKNNIQIKQSELSSQTDKYTLQQSEAYVLPSLNGSAYHGYNIGRAIDPFTNTFADSKVLSQNFSLSSSVTLFAGLQNYNNILQNQYNFAAGKYDLDKAKNSLALNVATGYLQVLFGEELAEVARSQADVTAKQEEQTKRLVEAGKLAKGSLLDIQAQMASDELSMVNAQNQLDISYLTLGQLLNLESIETFKIAKPEIVMPADPSLVSTSSQIYLSALGILPEIKSAESRLKSAEKTVAASKGGASPRLSLSGSYGTGYSGANKELPTFNFAGYKPTGAVTDSGGMVYSPSYVASSAPVVKSFDEQFKQNVNKSFGLRLTIPLFNGLQTKTNISKAKIQEQNADYNLQLAKLQLLKTIQQAYADAGAALKKYYATLKAHDAILESFSYAEQKFNLGVVNALDYVTAKGKLVKAESDLLQAKYDYIFKTKVLDFYQGKPITF